MTNFAIALLISLGINGPTIIVSLFELGWL